MWYREVIGGGRCPIVDTWWQTETGAIMITPLPGITALKPGSRRSRSPASTAEILDEDGEPVAKGEGGFLVITAVAVDAPRHLGRPRAVRKTYWASSATSTSPATAPSQDEDGDIWLLGRVDDVITSRATAWTAEIESALVAHPTSLRPRSSARPTRPRARRSSRSSSSRRARGSHVNDVGEGRAARTSPPRSARSPDRARSFIVNELPKTRSGKIMRRLLRDVAEGREIGDTTTLADIGHAGDRSPQVITARPARSAAVHSGE